MTEIEKKAIDKLAIEELVNRFDSEIRNIFYDVYGSSLERMPPDESMEQFLKALLRLNNPRAQKILLMRFGIVTGSPMQLQEVAEALGLTRERVRQIESMAIRRLRKPII